MGQSADNRRHVTGNVDTVDDRACTILHVDMDAFFASVELRRRPELRGRPMMVAGNTRSVVLSATYEARRFGVRSAMPVGAAKRLCPDIVVVPPDHQAYRSASVDVMAVFAEFTPLVEPISVDEAFLGVAGAGRSHGRPGRIAVNLRRRLADELGLPATVGAASTKFVAKLASGLAKPDGLLLVPPDEVPRLLRPLPVRALWGVGPKTAQQLDSLGLSTVGDVASTSRKALTRALGEAVGAKLHDLANGRDDRKVEGPATEVSIGAETTFDRDTGDRAALSRTLLELADRTARRARSAGLRGRTVTLKVRWADFTTVNRSLTLPEPTDITFEIHQTALGLLNRIGSVGRRVRLLGIRLENLLPADRVTEQLTLDFAETAPSTSPTARIGVTGSPQSSIGPSRRAPDRQTWRTAEGALDQVHARFGSAAVSRASSLFGQNPTSEARSQKGPADSGVPGDS